MYSRSNRSYIAPAAIFLAFVLLFLTCVSVPFAQEIRLFTLVDRRTGGSIRFGLWGYCLPETVHGYPPCTMPEIGWTFDYIPTLTGLEGTISSRLTGSLLIHPIVTAVVFVIFIFASTLILRLRKFRRKSSVRVVPAVLTAIAAVLATCSFIIDAVVVIQTKVYVSQATGSARNMKAYTGAIAWLSFIAAIILWANFIALSFLPSKQTDRQTDRQTARESMVDRRSTHGSDISSRRGDFDARSIDSSYSRKRSDYSAGSRDVGTYDDDRNDDYVDERQPVGTYDGRSRESFRRSATPAASDEGDEQEEVRSDGGFLATCLPCLGRYKDKDEDEEEEDIELDSIRRSDAEHRTSECRPSSDDLRRRRSRGSSECIPEGEEDYDAVEDDVSQYSAGSARDVSDDRHELQYDDSRDHPEVIAGGDRFEEDDYSRGRESPRGVTEDSYLDGSEREQPRETKYRGPDSGDITRDEFVDDETPRYEEPGYESDDRFTHDSGHKVTQESEYDVSRGSDATREDVVEDGARGLSRYTTDSEPERSREISYNDSESRDVTRGEFTDGGAREFSDPRSPGDYVSNNGITREQESDISKEPEYYGSANRDDSVEDDARPFSEPRSGSNYMSDNRSLYESDHEPSREYEDDEPPSRDVTRDEVVENDARGISEPLTGSDGEFVSDNRLGYESEQEPLRESGLYEPGSRGVAREDEVEDEAYGSSELRSGGNFGSDDGFEHQPEEEPSQEPEVYESEPESRDVTNEFVESDARGLSQPQTEGEYMPDYASEPEQEASRESELLEPGSRDITREEPVEDGARGLSDLQSKADYVSDVRNTGEADGDGYVTGGDVSGPGQDAPHESELNGTADRSITPEDVVEDDRAYSNLQSDIPDGELEHESPWESEYHDSEDGEGTREDTVENVSNEFSEQPDIDEVSDDRDVGDQEQERELLSETELNGPESQEETRDVEEDNDSVYSEPHSDADGEDVEGSRHTSPRGSEVDVPGSREITEDNVAEEGNDALGDRDLPSDTDHVADDRDLSEPESELRESEYSQPPKSEDVAREEPVEDDARGNLQSDDGCASDVRNTGEAEGELPQESELIEQESRGITGEEPVDDDARGTEAPKSLVGSVSEDRSIVEQEQEPTHDSGYQESETGDVIGGEFAEDDAPASEVSRSDDAIVSDDERNTGEQEQEPPHESGHQEPETTDVAADELVEDNAQRSEASVSDVEDVEDVPDGGNTGEPEQGPPFESDHDDPESRDVTGDEFAEDDSDICRSDIGTMPDYGDVGEPEQELPRESANQELKDTEVTGDGLTEDDAPASEVSRSDFTIVSDESNTREQEQESLHESEHQEAETSNDIFMESDAPRTEEPRPDVDIVSCERNSSEIPRESGIRGGIGEKIAEEDARGTVSPRSETRDITGDEFAEDDPQRSEAASLDVDDASDDRDIDEPEKGEHRELEQQESETRDVTGDEFAEDDSDISRSDVDTMPDDRGVGESEQEPPRESDHQKPEFTGDELSGARGSEISYSGVDLVSEATKGGEEKRELTHESEYYGSESREVTGEVLQEDDPRSAEAPWSSIDHSTDDRDTDEGERDTLRQSNFCQTESRDITRENVVEDDRHGSSELRSSLGYATDDRSIGESEQESPHGSGPENRDVTADELMEDDAGKSGDRRSEVSYLSSDGSTHEPEQELAHESEYHGTGARDVTGGEFTEDDAQRFSEHQSGDDYVTDGNVYGPEQDAPQEPEVFESGTRDVTRDASVGDNAPELSQPRTEDEYGDIGEPEHESPHESEFNGTADRSITPEDVVEDDRAYSNLQSDIPDGELEHESPWESEYHDSENRESTREDTVENVSNEFSEQPDIDDVSDRDVGDQEQDLPRETELNGSESQEETRDVEEDNDSVYSEPHSDADGEDVDGSKRTSPRESEVHVSESREITGDAVLGDHDAQSRADYVADRDLSEPESELRGSEYSQPLKSEDFAREEPVEDDNLRSDAEYSSEVRNTDEAEHKLSLETEYSKPEGRDMTSEDEVENDSRGLSRDFIPEELAGDDTRGYSESQSSGDYKPEHEPSRVSGYYESKSREITPEEVAEDDARRFRESPFSFDSFQGDRSTDGAEQELPRESGFHEPESSSLIREDVPEIGSRRYSEPRFDGDSLRDDRYTGEPGQEPLQQSEYITPQSRDFSREGFGEDNSRGYSEPRARDDYVSDDGFMRESERDPTRQPDSYRPESGDTTYRETGADDAGGYSEPWSNVGQNVDDRNTVESVHGPFRGPEHYGPESRDWEEIESPGYRESHSGGDSLQDYSYSSEPERERPHSSEFYNPVGRDIIGDNFAEDDARSYEVPSSYMSDDRLTDGPEYGDIQESRSYDPDNVRENVVEDDSRGFSRPQSGFGYMTDNRVSDEPEPERSTFRESQHYEPSSRDFTRDDFVGDDAGGYENPRSNLGYASNDRYTYGPERELSQGSDFYRPESGDTAREEDGTRQYSQPWTDAGYMTGNRYTGEPERPLSRESDNYEPASGDDVTRDGLMEDDAGRFEVSSSDDNYVPSDRFTPEYEPPRESDYPGEFGSTPIPDRRTSEYYPGGTGVADGSYPDSDYPFPTDADPVNQNIHGTERPYYPGSESMYEDENGPVYGGDDRQSSEYYTDRPDDARGTYRESHVPYSADNLRSSSGDINESVEAPGRYYPDDDIDGYSPNQSADLAGPFDQRVSDSDNWRLPEEFNSGEGDARFSSGDGRVTDSVHPIRGSSLGDTLYPYPESKKEGIDPPYPGTNDEDFPMESDMVENETGPRQSERGNEPPPEEDIPRICDYCGAYIFA